MPCRERDIAESVKDAINAGSYSMTVTAKRSWVPVWESEDLENMVCHVSPANQSAGAQTRTTMSWDYPVVVGFGRKINKLDLDDEVDALADFVEEVVDEIKLEQRTLSDSSTVSNYRVEYQRHADVEFLTEKGIFISLVEFGYRVVA